MTKKQIRYVLMRNILTLFGSLVLVVSWYFEKITVAKYNDIINEKRGQFQDFNSLVQYNGVIRGFERIGNIMQLHDSNSVSREQQASLLLSATLTSYFAQEHAKNMAIEEITSWQVDYPYIKFLMGLHQKTDINALGEELYKQNDLVSKSDLKNQHIVNNYIKEAKKN